ncbi:hypothetical protein MAXJ12_29360 [Mesorhizobium alhagi CCNWXJ12-2]|uniref:Uncharacterized protein n=2 Tax=Allomesorhizobium alhagi TaxID=475067 RepID=H0I085_9HYPH|nr:hypothetical protein MAXJ12_29360 [Mesorhizobium alhagi CCNWXJ12-2]
MQGGAVATATPLIGLHDDLTVVLQEVIKERVNLVFDQPGEINIVVPTLPNDVLTRDDLIKYLRDYHRYGQGRHYHDELATAVLFGCR